MTDNQTYRGSDPGSFSPLPFMIQDKPYSWPHQYITGLDLKKLGGIHPEQALYMSLIDPFDDQIIANDEEVNLARPNIERFYIRQPLEFVMENTKYSWDSPIITAVDLRKLKDVEEGDEIWLKVTPPFQDELIDGTKKVDLTRSEVEHFYLRKLKVRFRINDVEYEIIRGKHTVAELRKLANVKATDEFAQLIDHNFFPLEDSATVVVEGGEQFFAHVRDGSSS